jgi:hypothetical protein
MYRSRRITYGEDDLDFLIEEMVDLAGPRSTRSRQVPPSPPTTVIQPWLSAPIFQRARVGSLEQAINWLWAAIGNRWAVLVASPQRAILLDNLASMFSRAWQMYSRNDLQRLLTRATGYTLGSQRLAGFQALARARGDLGLPSRSVSDWALYRSVAGQVNYHLRRKLESRPRG